MLTSRSGIDPSALFSDLDLASRKTVVAAVSGGGDSTALLLLLKSHLDRSVAGTRLVAATVDHRLRPGSAAEVEEVARLCARLGIEHRSLAWTGPKPATGLSAAAREARHDLLAEAARSVDSDLVVTAHTADDQAETVTMRRDRDEGRGLAGIAPATLFCGTTWFARPLLAVRRKALRDVLLQSGTRWAEDPTNVDPAYERPRLRVALAGPGGEERTRAALLCAAEAAAKRRADGDGAARLICGHATQVARGLTRLDRKFTGEGEASVLAMRILLAAAGGRPHLPDSRRAAALVSRAAAGEVFRAALSRCLADARPDGLFLLREGRGLPQATPVADGMIWDGRFRIGCTTSNRVVVPFGTERAKAAAGPDRSCPQSLARAALAAEPLILEATHLPMPGEDAGRRAGSPELRPKLSSGWIDPDASPPCAEGSGMRVGRRDDIDGRTGEGCVIERLLAPWARYLPSFDLAPARAAAALIGAREVPDPPFRRHNGYEA